MLRFLTAGESHGKALVAVLEGVPAGLAIDLDAITTELRRRQTGYGRGRRMLIESDRAEPLSGVRHGLSTGGPIALLIPLAFSFQQVRAISAESPLHCADAEVELRMIAEIDRARDAGDTMGGSFEIIAHDVPPGLGSYVQWDRKLDGRLAQALMSIPAIKGVGIGRGPAAAALPGSRLHDEILPTNGRSARVGVVRPTNNAGGLEGGVTNGED